MLKKSKIILLFLALCNSEPRRNNKFGFTDSKSKIENRQEKVCKNLKNLKKNLHSNLNKNVMFSVPVFQIVRYFLNYPRFSSSHTFLADGSVLFHFFRFPNDPCNTGGTKNGTCYTS